MTVRGKVPDEKDTLFPGVEVDGIRYEERKESG